MRLISWMGLVGTLIGTTATVTGAMVPGGLAAAAAKGVHARRAAAPTAYVTDTRMGTVTPVNTATNKAEPTIYLGTGPDYHEIAITP
jgi:DNA-binding beta-propeller fold protein YncE